MNLPPRLVERAYPNAVGTVISILCPPLEALFTIHIPLQAAGMIRDVMTFHGLVVIGDCLGGAMLGALLTDVTEFLDPERLVGVMLKWKIGKHLANTDTRTEFLSNQKSQPTRFSQSCRHGKRNTKGCIVPAWYGPVTEASNECSQ